MFLFLFTIILAFVSVGILLSQNNSKGRGSDTACTMDAKVCDDGSYVGRNPNNNCEFFDCPSSNQLFCTQEVVICPDGTYVGRESQKNCQFKLCPDGTQL